MQRLQRFKWIPMLLKAWNEARERTETRPPSETDVSVTIEDAATSTRQGSGSKQGRSTKIPAQTPLRQAKRPVARLRRPAGQTVSHRVRTRRIPHANYQAVLQELREAKQQLGQLDSIRHQLDDMQAWFEQRMATQTAQTGSWSNPNSGSNPGMSGPGSTQVHNGGQGPLQVRNPGQNSGQPFTSSAPRPNFGAGAAERIGFGQGVHTDPEKEGSD